MSEIGDTFKEYKKIRSAKKQSNAEYSMQQLNKSGFPFKCLHGIVHVRVDDRFDFWPSTGRFRDIRTNKFGRGIKNLLKLLRKDK